MSKLYDNEVFSEQKRKALEEFLSQAENEDYDAVVYFLSGLDYDVTNEKEVRYVADLVLKKVTEVTRVGYKLDERKHYFDIKRSEEQVLRREKADVKCLQERGTLYVPRSEDFDECIHQIILSFARTSEERREFLEKKYGLGLTGGRKLLWNVSHWLEKIQRGICLQNGDAAYVALVVISLLYCLVYLLGR